MQIDVTNVKLLFPSVFYDSRPEIFDRRPRISLCSEFYTFSAFCHSTNSTLNSHFGIVSKSDWCGGSIKSFGHRQMCFSLLCREKMKCFGYLYILILPPRVRERGETNLISWVEDDDSSAPFVDEMLNRKITSISSSLQKNSNMVSHCETRLKFSK